MTPSDPRDPPSDAAYFDREYFTPHPGKHAYHEAVIRLIAAGAPREGVRALDVGCGFGFLLEMMKQQGWQARGLEPSLTALEECRRRGLQVIAGSAEQPFPFDDATFDVIVINDVIEHLRDYETCLRESRRTLQPGGTLFIQTLSARSLARFLLGRRWTWYQDPTHVRLFAPGALARRIREEGFEVLACRTFFNFCQVGETTRWLRPLRRLRRFVYVPWIGDSFYVLARKV